MLPPRHGFPDPQRERWHERLANPNAFYEAHGFTRDGAERTEAAWAHLPEVGYRRPLP